MSTWINQRFSALIARVGLRAGLSLGLLLTILLSLVFGLAEIVRSLDAWFLLPFALLGLVSAWLLARSRVHGAVAGGLLLVFGVAWVFTRVGRLAGQLTGLVVTLNNLAVDFIRWRPGLPAPDPQPIAGAWAPLQAALLTLAGRLASWTSASVYGQAPVDPAAVALAWGAAVWLAAAWMGWGMRRWRQPLAAITPAVGLLTASLAWVNGPTGFILPVFTSALTLLAVNAYLTRQARWESQRTDYSEDIRLDLGMTVVAAAALLTGVAALAPAFSPARIADFFEELTRPPAAARTVPQAGGDPVVGGPPAFPSGAGETGAAATPTPAPGRALIGLTTGGLPRVHLLGSGGELAEIPVMEVQLLNLVAGESPPPVYWRALTYDRYSGRGWVTSATRLQTYPKNAWTAPEAGLYPLASESLAGERSTLPGLQVLEQEVVVFDPDSSEEIVLFAAGELLSADQPYTAAWRRAPGEEFSSALPPAGGDLFGASLVQPAYRALSLVAAPGETQLDAAGQDYPDWVRERYLQLPANIPGRVRSLARDLTATGPTPYQRVKAIETYLRSFPYNLQLPEPPRDRDLVDYFLFDLQQGYCDYYASSMVVLSRAAGIPARLAMGYAAGTYDPVAQKFAVSAAQAHSWPEIYFPGYGWVAFEPTAALPGVERPADPQTYARAPQETPGAPLSRLNWRALQRSAVFLALGLAGLLLAAWVVDWTRLLAAPPNGALALLYRRLGRRARALGVERAPATTPHEFAAAFARRWRALTGRPGGWTPALNGGETEAQQLVDLYARSAYSPHPVTAGERRTALRLWRRLALRLWLAKWLIKRGPEE